LNCGPAALSGRPNPFNHLADGSQVISGVRNQGQQAGQVLARIVYFIFCKLRGDTRNLQKM